jgi:hypothetical protein
MGRHSYRITLEHLATPNGNGKLQEPLSFEVDNHDDIFAIAQKVCANSGLDSSNATALAVGLKLFTEVMLTHPNDPRFAALRVPMRDFIGQLKARQPNIEGSAVESL